MRRKQEYESSFLEYHLPFLEHESSLLFRYIQDNDLEKVKEFLIDMDRNIMLICDKYSGQDSLMYALSLNHIEIAKILIPHAKLSLQDNNGNTALHLAVNEDNSPNIKIIKVLIEAGIDVNLPNKAGFTALIGAVYDNNIEIVKALIKARAHLDYTLPDNGFTALHMAVFKDYTETAQTLIEAGANVNLPDKSGHTALHLAIFNNNINAVKALIKKGNLSVSQNEYIKMIDDFNIIVKNKDEKYIEGVVSCFIALIKSGSLNYENYSDVVKSFRLSSTIHKPENAIFKQKLFTEILEETKKYLNVIMKVE